MSNTLLSIILVNYNHCDFVGRAIDSIVEQRAESVELIVIDGRSTDGSVEEIEKRRSGLAHFESEPNSGQSEAFNKGIARASGKYLMWVNADDVLVPGSLRRLVDVLRAHPNVDWFAGNSVFMDQSEHILWVAYAMRPIPYILKAGITYVGGPSTIFSRKLFDTFGPFDESFHYSMDTDLWKRFIHGGHVYRRLGFHRVGFHCTFWIEDFTWLFQSGQLGIRPGAASTCQPLLFEPIANRSTAVLFAQNRLMVWAQVSGHDSQVSRPSTCKRIPVLTGIRRDLTPRRYD